MTEEHDLEYEGWKKAVNYVKQNENELRAKYGTAYIAVMEDCGVIDRDNNELNLLDRTHRNTYTKKFILINTIEDIINRRIFHMDSPEAVNGR